MTDSCSIASQCLKIEDPPKPKPPNVKAAELFKEQMYDIEQDGKEAGGYTPAVEHANNTPAVEHANNTAAVDNANNKPPGS